ncbi:subtilisin family serine protease [Kitasatospora sp. SolWspMP-SS2h]|uniref:S8 family serine peptidase n=1 Tax=Kitasatospora sp. SolWspMP-SS2h TaxID=1305729 RepID=UPI000DBA3944|nr:S8 family serine peptidase [Kitasatospora sp. SolWspMP-SS2h]RAJ46261.1 subtilisin family serine protease [Kitasatospora sp. SolWspMP-SS2h]
MHLPRQNRRRTALWATAALTVTAGLVSSPLPAAVAAAPAPSASATVQVDPALTGAVAGGQDATFFVVLKDRADLGGAKGKGSHAEKAKAAYQELRDTAARSQDALKKYLDREKVGHQDYWIANAVQVTGDAGLVAKLAKRSDVRRIVKAQAYRIDDTPLAAAPSADAGDGTPEWGVKDIGADQVWSRYGARGEGVVIANVDSGVQYDHPDLVADYRGNNGDGTFTDDYNFYDPTGTCATPSTPCDNNGHGTHTMGTMVAKNGIGVAPDAKWIAAKGCESSQCSDEYLLKAGQWLLAPTDHNGNNPRPDLAPNIVNNSWGGGDTTFYQDIVEAWNSAGIFEAFAAGNDGDGTTCSTSHAPGSQAPSYGVGAYDVNGRIASFSGFGPSLVDGSAKPNISAPGVNVRSTWPGSAYMAESGTSMATPHVAGAVALLWSAAPSLIGDIDGTRALLDQGARDVDDTHCGGTAGANNVWGEGRLDILKSVDLAPHTAVDITGRATDRKTGAALPGITVKVSSQATGTRTVTTAPDGTYRLALAPGSYDVAASGYGYANFELKGLTVTTGQPQSVPLAMTAVASHAVTGTVLDVTGKPLAGAVVELTGTPVKPVVSGQDGSYTLGKVAEGDYTLTVKPAQPVLCNGVWTGPLAVAADVAETVRTPARTDGSGTSCAPAAYGWVKGSSKVALSGDEDAKTVGLPFPVTYYGVQYTSASVTTDGLIDFLEPRIGDYANTELPTAYRPNGVVAPFWDDLTLDKKATVATATTGRAGRRTFAVVWDDVPLVADRSKRVSFEVLFDEATGDITFQYESVPGNGSGATVGIENQAGTDALQYSFDQAVLTDGSAIRFTQGAK